LHSVLTIGAKSNPTGFSKDIWMDQPMKPFTQNAIAYCKPAINANSFSVTESSTPILLSEYGYPFSETQPGTQPKGLNRRLVGILYAVIV